MKVKSITPLDEGVLVEVIEEPKVSESGLALPDLNDKIGFLRGVVVAVGPGEMFNGQRLAMPLKVGDKVIFERPVKQEWTLEVGDKRCFMTTTYDIFGVYED